MPRARSSSASAGRQSRKRDLLGKPPSVRLLELKVVVVAAVQEELVARLGKQVIHQPPVCRQRGDRMVPFLARRDETLEAAVGRAHVGPDLGDHREIDRQVAVVKRAVQPLEAPDRCQGTRVIVT